MITDTQLFSMVARHLGISPKILTAETTIAELGLDSLEFLELLLAIGEDFHTIPDKSIPNLHTLADVLESLNG